MSKTMNLEVEEKDVTELLASHGEELYAEDLIQLEKQMIEEEEDMPTPELKTFTRQGLAGGFALIQEGLSRFEAEDPNMERYTRVARGVMDSLRCYKEILEEKKMVSFQTNLQQYFKKPSVLQRCALLSSCSGCERRSAGKQSGDVTALLSGCPALTTRPEKQSAEDRQQKTDKEIIIKPADKGGGIVVMDKIKYIQEVHRQLNDTSIYTPLNRDPTNTVKELINVTLMKYCEEGVLDQKTCEYLTKQNPITPVFYILPKIHKSLDNPPGRPIVASTESILSPTSKFLEKILTPLIQQTPSFLLGTGTFLQLIQNLTIIPKEAFLVTFDAKDLYTSIPHLEGIQSVRTLLTSSNMDPVQINLCCDLLSIILPNNFFLFEDKFFLQTRGTTMGSNVAPPYANCYMADYEKTAIYTNDLFQTHARVWKRYIDDIFCIWDGPEETLKTFFLFLKSSWPGLDFTMSYNLKEINFLDTLVCKNEEGELSTDLFTKPTDRNSLLHYHSFHPTRMKNSIPKSQFKRVQRIVSDKTKQNEIQGSHPLCP
ncbi:unnamed protein product [Ranitomeya imitator]|uniref:Reverse transcriptase domain-containing protein n=1 Tax=Ranitomeya imitator TaxID=111125 RepID=A0ABN9KY80_9NEOB|nr:unnamed protein product [Ranitomeya imitator]